MRAFPCTLTRCDYRGWQAVHLSNGIVELDIIPQLGGRVMQYRLGSHEFFYVNPRHCGRVYSPTENCFEMGWIGQNFKMIWFGFEVVRSGFQCNLHQPVFVSAVTRHDHLAAPVE